MTGPYKDTWLIRFDFPEQTLWAGWHKNALGFAPTERSACTFLSDELARRTLANGYGEETRSYGTVIRVRARA